MAGQFAAIGKHDGLIGYVARYPLRCGQWFSKGIDGSLAKRATRCVGSDSYCLSPSMNTGTIMWHSHQAGDGYWKSALQRCILYRFGERWQLSFPFNSVACGNHASLSRI